MAQEVLEESNYFIIFHDICDNSSQRELIGVVTERLKVLAWKVSVPPQRVPGVRIPPTPLA